jgi:hypothetical protein
MPEVAKLTLVFLLAAALAVGALAPPPRPRRRFEACLMVLSAGAFYLVAAGLTIEGHAALATPLLALGVLTLGFACWLARGPEDRDDGPGDDFEPEPDPPIDWDEFDRLREEWARTAPRPLVLVG